MKKLILLLTLLIPVPIARAQNADEYRGGWRTDSDDPHTYEFVIRDQEVRGVYCTHCSDATTLAFIDGTLGPDGLDFVVTHVDEEGQTTYRDRARAVFDDGRLIVTGTSGMPGGDEFRRTVIKDPRGPAPLPVPVSMLPPREGPVPAIGGRGGRGGGSRGGGPRGGAAGGPGPGGRGGYEPPGPWRQLTPEDVVGVWIGFGVGVDKQYFIIRKVGDGLRGMVCGRCDNPYTMAALDHFVIEGETMTFAIQHEDWGPGSLPFINQATVRVAMNEMRLTTQQDNMPAPDNPPGPNAGTSLIGPISIEATRGNN